MSNKVSRYIQRNLATYLNRRQVPLRSEQACVSFTFDDFPKTSWTTGGAILERNGAMGTFFISFGLLGGPSPSGAICTEQDISALMERGHELGCHTYSHCHSWQTSPAQFEQDILRNRARLQQLFSGAEFKTFSYPLSEPSPGAKRRAGSHFKACRAGGQACNLRVADLSQLSSYFLERAHGDLKEIAKLMDDCVRGNGWLIFSTHDIQDQPSPYGCTPEFFESVVRLASRSGARVVSMAQAMEHFGI